MKKLRIICLLLLVASLTLPFYDLIIDSTMLASTGTRLLPNPNYPHITGANYSGLHFFTNGLLHFQWDKPEPAGMGWQKLSGRGYWNDWQYEQYYLCNGTGNEIITNYDSKELKAVSLTSSWIEAHYHYEEATRPTGDLYVRLYANLPIINRTFVTTATDNSGIKGRLKFIESTGGNFSGVYIPGVGWHNASKYASGWHHALRSENFTDWDDNWIVWWNDFASLGHSDYPLLVQAFTNRTRLNTYNYFYCNHDSGKRFSDFRFDTKFLPSPSVFTEYICAIWVDDFNNLTEITTKAEEISHMAITERDLTYTESSSTDTTVTYQVSATFENQTITGWDISPNTKVPTFPYSSGAEVWSLFGNVTYVDNNSEFTVPKTFTPTYDTLQCWDLVEKIQNFMLSNQMWVNQSSPYVVGWKENNASANLHNDYTADTLVGYNLFHDLSGNDTFYAYIQDHADYLCSIQDGDGQIPKKVTIATGVEYEDSNSVFSSLIVAYNLIGNSTYLDCAEKHWNWVNSNNKWDRYSIDIQVKGTLLTYDATSNSTYYNVLLDVIDDIFTGGKGISGVWDDVAGVFGTDVSLHSHSLIALDYVLLRFGDITSRNLTDAIRKGIEWNIRMREAYGGQIQNLQNRYPLYPCHQNFAGLGSLLFAKYLYRENNVMNKTYFTHALENFGWIEGRNELNIDFFTNEGKVLRCIKLVDGVPTGHTKYPVCYDQGYMIGFLAALSEFQNYVYAYDRGLTPSDVYITECNGFLQNVSLASSTLTLSLDSDYPTSTTKIYCGSRGEPQKVTGATSYSYNNATKILTLTVTHSSRQEVSIDWAVKILGDVNGDGVVDASDLFNLSKAYGSKFGRPNWNSDCDFDKDYKVDALDLFDLGKNYGKTTS